MVVADVQHHRISQSAFEWGNRVREEGGGFQASELRHFGQHHYGSEERESELASSPLLVDGTKRKGSTAARGNVKANATSF